MTSPSKRAVLFTDVVDSTRLTERLGDARAAELWALHDAKARDLLARHDVREIDRTDGFFLVFDRAADAAAFALAYHAALAELGMQARAGLHFGPTTLRQNKPEDVARGAKRVEVDGLATPLAARVMSLARGGQTLLTSDARDALDIVPDGAQIERHGHYRMKGILEPVEIYELGTPGVAPFLPPQDVDKAYRVVRMNDLWRPAREVRNNLPAERDAFVGRARELHAFAAQLDAGARLLTVQGTAGTGKTRLARRYAWTWLGEWPGGVYFCDLSDVRSLDGIYLAVAGALDVPLGRDDPGVQLGQAIAARGRCFVILDNFEQLVTHAATTVGRWLDRAPSAVFAVTSRERLHLRGEEIFAVEPLSIERDGIELFAVRARAQQPDFVLNDTNRDAVAEVVRLLDGLPLAIELAAARARLLSPAQLVDRMRDRFTLLAGARGAAARQATLRAAIDWSWDLLTPPEQAAFAQCSMFDGGFSLDAAEAVLDLSAWPQAPSAMDVVQSLCDKSLLRTWLPAGHMRYDLHEPFFGMFLSIREYAEEKLDASGAANRRGAEERHGRYFASFGSEDVLGGLNRTGGVRLRRALVLELDNLIAACRRAQRRGDVATAVAAYVAAWVGLEAIAPAAIGVALGGEILRMEGIDTPWGARLQTTRGMALMRAGRLEEAAAAFEEALGHFRACHDRGSEARTLARLGNLRTLQGRPDEAREIFKTALAAARETRTRWLEGQILGQLGTAVSDQGWYDEAQSHYEQALAIHREVGNRHLEGVDLGNLANVHADQRRSDEARTHYLQAQAIYREVGNRRDEAAVIVNLGMLARDEGRLDEARVHYGEALAITREVGDPRVEGFTLGVLADLLYDQGLLDDAMTEVGHALAVTRAAGNRRSEGLAYGTMGKVLAKQRRYDQAREALGKADTVMREIGDRYSRGELLCDRARLEIAAGDEAAARAALDEAGAIIDVDEGGAAANLSRRIAEIRGTLA